MDSEKTIEGETKRVHLQNGTKVWRWYPKWYTNYLEVGDTLYKGNSSKDYVLKKVIDLN